MSASSWETERACSPTHPPVRPPTHPVCHDPRPEQDPEEEEDQQEPSSGSGVSLLVFAGLLVALVVWLTGSAWAGPGQPASVAFSPSPGPATSWVQLAERDAQEAGISPALFVRQIQQESGFNPRARSSAGAEGIAQFMPATAAGLGIDPWNPVQALKAAAQLMARYEQQYGGSAQALAAYNCGSGCLSHALAACGSAWQGCLPAETRAYLRVILLNQ